MQLYRYWFKYALFFLFAVAAAGILLRTQFLTTPFIVFSNFLHTHSHVAMLGWLFNAVFILLVHYFIPEHKSGKIKALYILIQISIFGMLVSFSIQGYAAFSIAFSTAHLLFSYYFIYLFFRLTDGKNQEAEFKIPLKFVYSSLIFSAISSIGPWSLAVFLARGGNSSAPFYNMAIYFYLHFLYNGFFTFGLTGILLHLLIKAGAALNKNILSTVWWMLVISILPAYTHSILGYNFHVIIYIIAAISSFIEIIAVRYLFSEIYSNRKYLFSGASRPTVMLFKLGILCMIIKFVLQYLSILPGLKEYVFNSRELVLGYLHLSLLGFLSFTALAIAEKANIISYNDPLKKRGIYLLIFGFISTEILLFIPGLNIFFNFGILPNFYLYLFICSVFMLAGISILFFRYMFEKNST